MSSRPSSVVKDLRVLFSQPDSEFFVDQGNYNLSDVAEKAREYIVGRRIPESGIQLPGASLNFWIGGYSSHQEFSDVFRLDIIDGVCVAPSAIQVGDQFGWATSGDSEAVSRLLNGYSLMLPNILENAGLDQQTIENVKLQMMQNTSSQLIEASMPVQDAIDLARFVVDTVKGYVRFRPEANTVGGDTDIALVTKHEGFKWIQRKHFYNVALNRETDHVK